MNRPHPIPSPDDARSPRLHSHWAYRVSPAEDREPAKSPALKSVRRDAARRAEADAEIRELLGAPRDRR